MKLNQRLYELFEKKAKTSVIHRICLGLGYTAVSLEDGCLGVAFTYFERKTHCSPAVEQLDHEGRPASGLLGHILGEDALLRSAALALINALSQPFARKADADPKMARLIQTLGVGPGSRVAMLGCFPPVVPMLKNLGAQVEVLDRFKNMGDPEAFREKLASWADCALITATSILNNSMEEVLSFAGEKVKTAVLGPSTPMVPEAFSHLPVHVLAGFSPKDAAAVFTTIAHGHGTRAFLKYGKKVIWTAS